MAHKSSSTYNYNVRHSKKTKRFKWLFEVLTLLFAGVLILCAYAGKFSPENFFPGPFLTLAYMPMLLLAGVILIIAILFRRWAAVITLIIAFVTTLPVFKFYVPLNSEDKLPPMPVDTAAVFKVMTYNVLGFNYSDPLSAGQDLKTISLILDAAPDVVILQEGGAPGIEWFEIPALQQHRDEINARYPYIYSSPEGLNIMSRFPFTTCTLGEPKQTRTVLGYNRETTAYLARAYDLQLPSGKQLRLIDFRLQSYHLQFGKSMTVRISPDAKPSPLERMKRSSILRSNDAAAIRQAIDESPGNVIVCGDMNDVSTSHVYRTIRGEDLTDAWNEVGHGYAYTFNRHHLPFRIDHVLYRGALQAVQAERIKGGSSDHYPLMVTFDIDVTNPHSTEDK